ncbi:MAG: CRISPR-associated protein Cas4 [Armatimonadota bacterium]|nr:MAG: CRISPR-associated protein Cas4 [Armatimonadota bacterium]
MNPSDPITGTHIHYFLVCPRKCWLSLHHLHQEADSDLVELGRLTHERTFARQQMREVDVDGFLRIDFTSEGIVHEIKHGQSEEQAHRMQLAYYLYQLRLRGVQTHGVLHYPNQRRKERVELTPELEAELQQVIQQVEALRQQPLPPQVPRPMRICRSCAYEEFCWSDDEEVEQ